MHKKYCSSTKCALRSMSTIISIVVLPPSESMPGNPDTLEFCVARRFFLETSIGDGLTNRLMYVPHRNLVAKDVYHDISISQSVSRCGKYVTLVYVSLPRTSYYGGP